MMDGNFDGDTTSVENTAESVENRQPDVYNESTEDADAVSKEVNSCAETVKTPINDEETLYRDEKAKTPEPSVESYIYGPGTSAYSNGERNTGAASGQTSFQQPQNPAGQNYSQQNGNIPPQGTYNPQGQYYQQRPYNPQYNPQSGAPYNPQYNPQNHGYGPYQGYRPAGYGTQYGGQRPPVNNGMPQQKPKPKKKKSAVSFATCITLVIICSLLAGLISYAAATGFARQQTEELKKSINTGEVYNPDNGSTTVNGTEIKPGSNVTINVDTDSLTNAVYAKANKSVVGIRVVTSESMNPWANQTYTTVGEGSGIIYSANGIIVTNYHVVSSALTESKTLNSHYEVRVFLDTSLSKYYVAEFKGGDSTTDLAVLKINVTGLSPIEFADSDKIEMGESAIAIGSPGGLDFMNSVTYGIVSGVKRNMQTEDGSVSDLIQTDAAINPGNSGGALLNAEGKLIGINVMKIVSSGYEGLGFAIPSNLVKSIVNTILEEGEVVRPYLGITVNTNYTATEATQYGKPKGAWVAEVTAKSCADKAGIKTGDIIVAVAGKEISDYYELRAELFNHKPGESIEVKLYRGTQYITVRVVLDKAK